MSMNRVESIEKEIRALSPEDLATLREWFLEYDAAVWDQQLEQDAHTGRLEGLAEEAVEAYRKRKTTEL